MFRFSEGLTAKITIALSAVLLLLGGSTVGANVQVQRQGTDGLLINKIGSEASEEALEGIQSRYLDLMKESGAPNGLIEEQAEADVSHVLPVLGEGLLAGALVEVALEAHHAPALVLRPSLGLSTGYSF